MFNSYPAISLTPDLWASQLPSQSFDKAPREQGGLVLAPHQIGYLPKMLERSRWHIGVKMVFGNGHLYLSDDLELSRADNFSVQNTPRAMSRLLQLARICQEPLGPRLHCFRKPAKKHFHLEVHLYHYRCCDEIGAPLKLFQLGSKVSHSFPQSMQNGTMPWLPHRWKLQDLSPATTANGAVTLA